MWGIFIAYNLAGTRDIIISIYIETPMRWHCVDY